jgi:hypothetical protein
MMVRRLALALVPLGLLACGLSLTGVAVDEGAEAGASSSSGAAASGSTSGDASGGPSGDSGPVVPIDPCDAGALPAQAFILVPSSASCPKGTTDRAVQTAPQAQAGACSCGTCTPSADPSCADSSFDWRWGGDNNCTSGGPMSYNITANNACINLQSGNNFTLAGYNRWPTITPTPGSCTATAVTDGTKVTATALRACTPTAGASVCGTLGPGERLCAPATGACSGALSHAVTIGDTATVSCAACGCSRTATQCNVEYHDNTSCTHMVFQRPADNQCDATGSKSVGTIKVYPMNPTCTASPGTATASLSNPQALCCSD